MRVGKGTRKGKRGDIGMKKIRELEES